MGVGLCKGREEMAWKSHLGTKRVLAHYLVPRYIEPWKTTTAHLRVAGEAVFSEAGRFQLRQGGK